MRLIILASHPVQYHAPVFREVAQNLAQQGHDCLVVYLSDFSIQGYRDQGFGTTFAWDEPLLEGYRSVVLNPNSQEQPKGFWDLQAPGWSKILQQEKPTRILVTTLNYQGAIGAVLQAKLRGIPATLRVETNDAAFVRSPRKEKLRSLVYRGLYSLFDAAIAFGSLNRHHLLQNGIKPQKIGMAYFSVPDRFVTIPAAEKQHLRQALRQQLGFADRTVILFSGKLIPKKNPQLLLSAISQLPEDQRNQLAVLFLGSGELQENLQSLASQIPNLKYHFAGFKNQQELPPYYLASDLFVLPSNRQGEVWGLVVNEALQAGLPCIVTDAVGCYPDFAQFPDFQVVPEQDSTALAKAISQQLQLPRNFDRYRGLIQEFSIDYNAQQITDFLVKLERKQ